VMNFRAIAATSLSEYAKRMTRLSSRIFSEVVRPTDVNSMRVVRLFAKNPVNKRPEVVEYYPRHVEISHLMRVLRHLGLYRDEHADFADEMKRLKALRGKVKPKKGEGKRAMKKK